MINQRAGRISNALFLISIACIALIYLRTFPAYRNILEILFVITGASAIITALLESRISSEKQEFNLLYWISNLVLYAGLLMKLFHQPFSQFVIIAGAGLMAFSYLYNPFAQKSDSDDELLDQ